MTRSQNVARCQQRQIKQGWRRLHLRLPPDAAKSLASLEESTGLTATALIVALLTRRPKKA